MKTLKKARRRAGREVFKAKQKLLPGKSGEEWAG